MMRGLILGLLLALPAFAGKVIKVKKRLVAIRMVESEQRLWRLGHHVHLETPWSLEGEARIVKFKGQLAVAKLIAGQARVGQGARLALRARKTSALLSLKEVYLSKGSHKVDSPYTIVFGGGVHQFGTMQTDEASLEIDNVNAYQFQLGYQFSAKWVARFEAFSGVGEATLCATAGTCASIKAGNAQFNLVGNYFFNPNWYVLGGAGLTSIVLNAEAAATAGHSFQFGGGYQRFISESVFFQFEGRYALHRFKRFNSGTEEINKMLLEENTSFYGALSLGVKF
jgi:hypothetical protein